MQNIRIKKLSNQNEWTGDGASAPSQTGIVLGSAPAKGLLIPASGWARVWTIPVWLQGLYPYHQYSNCLGKGFTRCLFSYFHCSAMVSGYFFCFGSQHTLPSWGKGQGSRVHRGWGWKCTIALYPAFWSTDCGHVTREQPICCSCPLEIILWSSGWGLSPVDLWWLSGGGNFISCIVLHRQFL